MQLRGKGGQGGGKAHKVQLERRSPDEHRGLRVEAHGLIDDACCEAQLLHVLHGHRPVANHAVNLKMKCRIRRDQKWEEQVAWLVQWRGPLTSSLTLSAMSGCSDSRCRVQVSTAAVVSWPATSMVIKSSRSCLLLIWLGSARGENLVGIWLGSGWDLQGGEAAPGVTFRIRGWECSNSIDCSTSN